MLMVGSQPASREVVKPEEYGQSTSASVTNRSVPNSVFKICIFSLRLGPQILLVLSLVKPRTTHSDSSCLLKDITCMVSSKKIIRLYPSWDEGG